ncbi:MAG: NUDIX hydrolase [Mangrovibacterium sp.]
MYEVFFNECQLSFTTEINISSKDNINQVIGIEHISDFFTLLSALDGGHLASTRQIRCLISPELLKTLPENLKQISAAGGLVTDRNGCFLFIRRLGRWDLPKGAIEKNESAAQAAVREVEEETGLGQLEIMKELPETFHLYRSPHIRSANNWVLKKTFWFEMFHHGNGITIPQIEEDIEAARWFGQEELNEVFTSTYASLRKMLRFRFG